MASNPTTKMTANYVTCPKCGERITVAVRGLGRKRLNISVIFVYDTLRACRSVPAAATELGCSRGYIYKVCQEHGTSPKEVMRKRNFFGP